MSSTLKALTDRSDRKKSAQSKAVGKPAITGVVNSDYRVAGTPLALNKAEVRFYITVQTGTSSGDNFIVHCGRDITSVSPLTAGIPC